MMVVWAADGDCENRGMEIFQGGRVLSDNEHGG